MEDHGLWRRAEAIKDNTKVLHHWILYIEIRWAADGSITETGGRHTTAEMIHGWAPGGDDLDFRKHGNDVAMELPTGTYDLEVHCNSADAAAEDASGVDVCVRKSKPKNVAGLSWLGLDNGAESYISGALNGPWASGSCSTPKTEWVGTCNPWVGKSEPIHLLFVLPHMHKTGVHMKGIINGKSGTRTLHDEKFDFNYQTLFTVDDVLMPGETITTTCNYSEPKCAGQSTSSEMCYLYTYAYPKGALADNGPWGSLAHGSNVCLGQ